MPAYLDAIPTDVRRGSPFRYRVLKDEPQGRTYLLYSVGPNGVDDDGRNSRRERWRDRSDLPSLPEEGFRGDDYVYNRVNPLAAALCAD